jgi:FkbM family methyltransferase
MRVIDGGSRGGVESHWSTYGDQIEVLAFEPDEKESRRLNSLPGGPSGCRQRHFPVALGRQKGHATLNLARFPDSSSLFKNNREFLGRFAMAQYVEQIGAVEVELTDVDSLMVEQGLDYFDFMKLDVEGAELDVLEGAERALSDSVLGLTVEVWFHREHLERPLFSDIDSYLRRFDFALFDFREINRWRRKTLSGDGYASWIGSGQLMYSNALYFRDLPAQLAAGGPARGAARLRALKLASLAELFCYPDFAIEVLQSAGAAGAIEPDEAAALIRMLERDDWTSSGSGWKPFLRRSVRALIPPALRRKLMRALQGLVADG